MSYANRTFYGLGMLTKKATAKQANSVGVGGDRGKDNIDPCKLHESKRVELHLSHCKVRINF